MLGPRKGDDSYVLLVMVDGQLGAKVRAKEQVLLMKGPKGWRAAELSMDSSYSLRSCFLFAFSSIISFCMYLTPWFCSTESRDWGYNMYPRGRRQHVVIRLLPDVEGTLTIIRPLMTEHFLSFLSVCYTLPPSEVTRFTFDHHRSQQQSQSSIEHFPSSTNSYRMRPIFKPESSVTHSLFLS